ncbi:hypothetical protein V2S66_20935 [Streptomyces sp. V4-01]|uniref:Zinc ribbon domain-containing protein n=1 Tax=Actinacidiphila polyblastidii TaxID=3110430 RepID=A0ABU7PF49_9ACTN|nr:hypothetical protein [Streptomyces sp. V4-01]
MDYCYACRRHLNGAYSCPGCGTPADRLVLPGVGETAGLPLVTGEDGPDRGGGDALGGGRAARRAESRRSGARRARRGRQRAAVYGVGAVAVAGALTMFSMAALIGGSGGGAGSPGPGATLPVPGATSGPASPDDAGLFPSRPGGHRTSGTPSAPGSVSPSASTARPTTPPPTTHPVATTRPTTSAPPTTATPTPTHTRPPTQQPTPTQTTCKPVLWWCG